MSDSDEMQEIDDEVVAQQQQDDDIIVEDIPGTCITSSCPLPPLLTRQVWAFLDAQKM